MAIAVVQHVGNSTAVSSNTCISTIVSSTNNVLIIAVMKNGSSDSVTSVTDNQLNTYVQATSAKRTNIATVDIWYCLNATAGVTTITTNWGIIDTVTRSNEVWEISGIITPAFDLANNAGATGAANVITGASVTTTGTSGIIVANLVVFSGTVTVNPAAGNTFTDGGDINNGNIVGNVSKISSSASAQNAAWGTSAAAATNINSVAAFKETFVASTSHLLSCCGAGA